MIHVLNKHINEVFGISDDSARKLIDKVQPKWDVLISGSEGNNFTYSDILLSIFNSENFTNEEKYFLCSHVSRAFEIVVIRELILANDEEGFLDEMGFTKP